MEMILLDLSIIIIVAAFMAILAKFLKQPPILAYIVGGLLIGPFGFHLVQDIEFVKIIGELGIALLLFVVGLELSMERIKKVGGTAMIIGSAEVTIMTLLGFFIGRFFGFSGIESLYIGLIIAFSSTLVVIKLLSDNRELDTLHGRIMLGILLVQDVAVILALTFLINNDVSAFTLAKVGATGLLLIISAAAITKYILPLFFKKIAENQELLFLFALAWCFLFAGAASFLGFSIVIGAFIAGVTLANFPYNIEIIGRVKPIKDFFVTIFFVAIGIQIIPTIDSSLYAPIIVLFLTVILVKPFVISIFTSLSKYSRRTAFISGIGLAQVSEFSIILAMQGVLLNQISENLLSIAIILTAITMLVTTYFIKYDHKLYNWFGHIALFFNKRLEHDLSHIGDELNKHIIIFGAGRTGRKIVSSFKEQGLKLIIVDYNPDVIQGLISRKINCICGDAEDPEIIERLNLKHAHAIISTIPDKTINRAILRSLKRRNHNAMFFGVADNVDDALDLYESGADYVILPQILAGEKLTDILRSFSEKKIVDTLRLKQIVELEKIRNYELMEKHAPGILKFRDTIE
jgi:Kef-type K+ transport system membrane component KefB/Trk K+ transport system NAD-binding subunit